MSTLDIFDRTKAPKNVFPMRSAFGNANITIPDRFARKNSPSKAQGHIA